MEKIAKHPFKKCKPHCKRDTPFYHGWHSKKKFRKKTIFFLVLFGVILYMIEKNY